MPDPAARLIYHPHWEFRRFGETAVHFDTAKGNQDPYLWNDARSCIPTATSRSFTPKSATLISGCRATASRSLATSTVTWCSLWPGSTSGRTRTHSAGRTRSWTPMRHGRITTAGIRNTLSGDGSGLP
jgi:hypothetical protein